METKEVQQWTASRRVLVDVCAASTTSSSPRSGRGWTDTFVKGGEQILNARAEDERAAHEAEVRELREDLRASTRLGRAKRMAA